MRENRTKLVATRLTEVEVLKVDSKASQSGITRGEFIRNKILG